MVQGLQLVTLPYDVCFQVTLGGDIPSYFDDQLPAIIAGHKGKGIDISVPGNLTLTDWLQNGYGLSPGQYPLQRTFPEGIPAGGC
jgi:hypothetical protein